MKICSLLNYSFKAHNLHTYSISEKIVDKFVDEMKHILSGNDKVRFICGMNTNDEMLIATYIIGLKSTYKNLIFECALPDELQAVGWSEGERELYYNILSKCDCEKFINTRQMKENTRIQKKYMISSSDYIFIIADNENFIDNNIKNKKVIVLPTY